MNTVGFGHLLNPPVHHLRLIVVANFLLPHNQTNGLEICPNHLPSLHCCIHCNSGDFQQNCGNLHIQKGVVQVWKSKLCVIFITSDFITSKIPGIPPIPRKGAPIQWGWAFKSRHPLRVRKYTKQSIFFISLGRTVVELDNFKSYDYDLTGPIPPKQSLLRALFQSAVGSRYSTRVDSSFLMEY